MYIFIFMVVWETIRKITFILLIIYTTILKNKWSTVVMHNLFVLKDFNWDMQILTALLGTTRSLNLRFTAYEKGNRNEPAVSAFSCLVWRTAIIMSSRSWKTSTPFRRRKSTVRSTNKSQQSEEIHLHEM